MISYSKTALEHSTSRFFIGTNGFLAFLLICLPADILDGSLLMFGAALRHGGDQTESHLDVQGEAFEGGFGVEFSQGSGLTG